MLDANKKGVDVKQLSFVSFKIDTTPTDFEILIDPACWPKDKQIREFVNIAPPKQTFGRFLPQLTTNTKPPPLSSETPNAKSQRTTSEQMDVTHSMILGRIFGHDLFEHWTNKNNKTNRINKNEPRDNKHRNNKHRSAIIIK